MKDTLRVSEGKTRNFSESCVELGMKFECIGIVEDVWMYEVEYYRLQDIFALGQMMGLKSMYEGYKDIYNEDKSV